MLQVKVLRSLVVVIAVVAKLVTYALTEIVEVVAIGVFFYREFAVVAVVPVTFFRDVRRSVHEQWDMRLE